jgi:CheY-like chemotaxis protein
MIRNLGLKTKFPRKYKITTDSKHNFLIAPNVLDRKAARRMKQSDGTKSIPAVAVTSYAMAGDREAIPATGCQGCIEKPIDPDSFVGQLNVFLPPG